MTAETGTLKITSKKIKKEILKNLLVFLHSFRWTIYITRF